MSFSLVLVCYVFGFCWSSHYVFFLHGLFVIFLIGFLCMVLECFELQENHKTFCNVILIYVCATTVVFFSLTPSMHV